MITKVEWDSCDRALIRRVCQTDRWCRLQSIFLYNGVFLKCHILPYTKSPYSRNSGTKCSYLTKPDHGSVVPNECNIANKKQYKDVCTFKCDLGYVLHNKSTKKATCDKFGNWAYDDGYLEPRCIREKFVYLILFLFQYFTKFCSITLLSIE